MHDVAAQRLAPGFDLHEYTELLKVGRSFVDSVIPGLDIPHSSRFRRVYRSPVMGLENMWELHTDDRGTAVISLRGTTAKAVSWLANGYAAMIPATGSMQLEKGFTFDHQLAHDPQAAVHVGWTVGLGFLQRDILPKVDSLYKAGVRDVIITGHSQGGALAYLLTAHLWDLRTRGVLPGDLRLKTYASAAPKPGNLFFAHHYESVTREWAFNVVNAWDWVPETPMSIQTVDDFNAINPFTDGKTAMKDLPLSQRVVARHVYNKLDKPTRKAGRHYRKYLGGSASGFVQKNLPDYVPPTYAETNLYVRTGTIVTLMPDSDYYARFPQEKEQVFINHMLEPYVYLMERYAPDARAALPRVPEHAETAPDSRAFRERKIMDGISFHALGHEPAWVLDMKMDQGMRFSEGEGNVWFMPPVEPARAQDANVLRYHATTVRGALTVTVQELPCTDTLSGTVLPWTVRVEATDAQGSTLERNGCGTYLPPVRLQDVWMLTSLNGKDIQPGAYREAPRLEFYAAEGRVTGSGGCNGIGGGFVAVPGGIRFGNLISTLRACEGVIGTVEQDFLKALTGRELHTTFQANDLSLSHPDGTALVFRRVD